MQHPRRAGQALAELVGAVNIKWPHDGTDPHQRAERFATNNTRKASTLPVPVLAKPATRPDSAPRAASTTASVQREMPGWCRRERLDAEHTAVGVDDRGHVNVQMCVDSARR